MKGGQIMGVQCLITEVLVGVVTLGFKLQTMADLFIYFYLFVLLFKIKYSAECDHNYLITL